MVTGENSAMNSDGDDDEVQDGATEKEVSLTNGENGEGKDQESHL